SVFGGDHGGFDELIVFIPGVGLLQRADGARRPVFRHPLGEHVVHRLHPLPAVVPVHGVVAPADGGNVAAAHLGEGLLHQGNGWRGAAGRGVAAVEEPVQADIPAAAARGEADGGDKMVLVAVNPAGGEQAEQVHPAATGHGAVDGVGVDRIGKKVAVADGLVDTGEVLVDDAP